MEQYEDWREKWWTHFGWDHSEVKPKHGLVDSPDSYTKREVPLQLWSHTHTPHKWMLTQAEPSESTMEKKTTMDKSVYPRSLLTFYDIQTEMNRIQSEEIRVETFCTVKSGKPPMQSPGLVYKQSHNIWLILDQSQDYISTQTVLTVKLI